MPKFRKKPVVVEAEQFLPPSIVPTCVSEALDANFEPVYFIPTLEGPMQCSYGDWIITGVHGENYPCKPDIFNLTYELVKE
jgi:hypothetical protein